jgi:hypothetical protein
VEARAEPRPRRGPRSAPRPAQPHARDRFAEKRPSGTRPRRVARRPRGSSHGRPDGAIAFATSWFQTSRSEWRHPDRARRTFGPDQRGLAGRLAEATLHRQPDSLGRSGPGPASGDLQGHGDTRARLCCARNSSLADRRCFQTRCKQFRRSASAWRARSAPAGAIATTRSGRRPRRPNRHYNQHG